MMNEELELLDRIEEIRQKSIEEPEKYPIDYTIRVIAAIVADYTGYESRCDWTRELKKHPESMYATRILENSFHI